MQPCIQTVFAFAVVGAIIPFAEMDMFPPYPYETAADWGIVALSMIVLVQVAVYLALEFRVMISTKGMESIDISCPQLT